MASTDDEFTNRGKNPLKQDTEWVPLSLTFVEYPKGDWFGKMMALASLSPFGIVSGFIALILFRRDLHTIAFFIGTCFNELLNQILKNLICEARPLARTVNYTEYGMPSAHAQFSWFFATYVIYFVFIRLHHMNNNTTLENVWKAVILFTCISMAIIVTISRVYLQYHSWKQVVCGALVGIIFASAWFALTYLILTPYFPLVASCRTLTVPKQQHHHHHHRRHDGGGGGPLFGGSQVDDKYCTGM